MYLEAQRKNNCKKYLKLAFGSLDSLRALIALSVLPELNFLKPYSKHCASVVLIPKQNPMQNFIPQQTPTQ